MNFSPAAGSRLEGRFREYESYHRHPMNERLHFVGVPMIVLGVLGLASFVEVAAVDGGLVLWALAAGYYTFSGRALGLAFSGLVFLFYLGARELALSTLLACFLVGWIIQAVGHYRYERRSPAFVKNLEHLLIGPLWLFWRLFRLAARQPR